MKVKAFTKDVFVNQEQVLLYHQFTKLQNITTKIYHFLVSAIFPYNFFLTTNQLKSPQRCTIATYNIINL